MKHMRGAGDISQRIDRSILSWMQLARLEQLGLVRHPKRGFWSIPLSRKTLYESEGTTPSEEKDKIETLDEFTEWARQFESGKYVFRGVPNAAYGIQASAFRRPEEKKRDFEKFSSR